MILTEMVSFTGFMLDYINYIKFQGYSMSFQEPEIEFSRSACKKISMPYIMFQCFLCCKNDLDIFSHVLRVSARIHRHSNFCI